MLDFGSVVSYLKNGDETHFKRKKWKRMYIFLNKKTGDINYSSKSWGIDHPYRPSTEDMFAFDWIVVGGK